MKKFTLAVIVLAIVMLVGVNLEAQRKESNLRALERAALQQEIEDGNAPMAWMCAQFRMDMTVNDDGAPLCSGTARWNNRQIVHETIAAFHLAESCKSVSGTPKIDGQVQAGAPQLVVRCVGTRFEQRWNESK